MSIFKKFFGSKENKKPAQASTPQQPTLNPTPKKKTPDDVPWMTDLRRDNLSTAQNAGFTPTVSLPTDLGRELRPTIEIAKRLNAINALVLWLMVPEDSLGSENILSFVDRNDLRTFMTAEEQAIFSLPRNDEQARNAIGWKFENAWPLAWYFGYKEPAIDGQMMEGDQMQEILKNYSCPPNKTMEEWVQSKETRSEDNLLKKEDLFYCLHNAVRSAQIGGATVPAGFHPVSNGGVIHERRHSLTWMVSKGVRWEETDLST